MTYYVMRGILKNKGNQIMAKLIKTQKAKDIFTITVEGDTYAIPHYQSYQTSDPVNSIITKVLVYAKQNDWNIDEDFLEDKIPNQLYKLLENEKILDIPDIDLVDKKIKALTQDISIIAPYGIRSITITKFGEEYDLEVTKDDIRDIIFDMM